MNLCYRIAFASIALMITGSFSHANENDPNAGEARFEYQGRRSILTTGSFANRAEWERVVRNFRANAQNLKLAQQDAEVSLTILGGEAGSPFEVVPEDPSIAPENLDRTKIENDLSGAVDPKLTEVLKLSDQELYEKLGKNQKFYVKHHRWFFFTIRCGGNGLAEGLHLFMVHHAPQLLAFEAGLTTSLFVLFNANFSIQIANWINYGKWARYNPEIAAMEARFQASKGFRKASLLAIRFFRTFVYEALFHLALQTTLKYGLGIYDFGFDFASALAQSGSDPEAVARVFDAGIAAKGIDPYLPIPISVQGSVGSVFAGAVGEFPVDQAEGEFQDWSIRRGTNKLIAEANLRLMATVASLLSVSGILISSSNFLDPLSWIPIIALNAFGIGTVYYIRHTEKVLGWIDRFDSFAIAPCRSLLRRMSR